MTLTELSDVLREASDLLAHPCTNPECRHAAVKARIDSALRDGFFEPEISVASTPPDVGYESGYLDGVKDGIESAKAMAFPSVSP